MYSIAIHGFKIIEVRENFRLLCFKSRSTVTKYEVCRARILDLVRDRRNSHLKIREFEIWDGITFCSKFRFENGRLVASKNYVPDKDTSEAMERDLDYEYATKNRKKNQRTGRVTGDITQWLKKEALPRELCMMSNSRDYRASKPNKLRIFGDTK